jgi:hypothetical protein
MTLKARISASAGSALAIRGISTVALTAGALLGAMFALSAAPALATTPPEPTVLAASASGETRVGAQLSGAVNPQGSPTFYRFEYGPTAAYGSTTPEAEAGSGTGETPVGPTTLSGLHPGVTYHYRLIAASGSATALGEDETFTTLPPTPPIVSTGAASNLTQIAATLTATIDPRGLHTTYEFQLGPTTVYGTETFGDAGQGDAPEAFAVSALFLTPGSTYHYRIEASSADGQSYGADATFTTPTYPLLAPPPSTGTPHSSPALTRAQKLAKALKACRRKPRARRARCQRQARRRYGPPKKHRGH